MPRFGARIFIMSLSAAKCRTVSVIGHRRHQKGCAGAIRVRAGADRSRIVSHKDRPRGSGDGPLRPRTVTAAGTVAAATTLLKLLAEPGVPPSVRARAADSIFNDSAKAIEIEDVEARVTELEKSAEVQRQRRQARETA